MAGGGTTVAVAVERGAVAPRLGRAVRFEVLTVASGRVVHRALRLDPGAGGDDEVACRGRRLASLLGDCDAVLAGDVGPGITAHLRERGVEVGTTDCGSAEEAVLAYVGRRLSGG